MLRFTVLGRVEARDGERLLDLGPARRTSVLAALLVDVGRTVPFDVLAERVWDGHAPASATGTLQAHVSRLRTALGDTRGGPVVLRTTPTGYLLDVDDGAVDARRFAALVRDAEELARRGERADARDRLADAFELWRGPAYGDVVADFATREAARLDDMRLDAHELAAELDLDADLAAAVAERLGPLVVGYPFREHLRACLVRALRGAGRRAEALECLRAGRRLLVDELGVEPGVELRELQQAILAEGSPEPVVAAAEEPAPGACATVRPPPVGSAEPAVGELVGRGEELAAVLDACRRSAAGETLFVALRGEAGIGKTRLAEETAARVDADGHLAVWGRCWPHEGSPALWPWIEVLRDLDRLAPPQVFADAVHGRGAALATVVPELADHPDAEGDDGTVPPEVRVFDAVLHVLGRLGAYRPLLVVLDDVQWADPLSQRLLEYLAGHAREQRLTVLATVRAGGTDRVDAGLAVLAALARSGRLTALEVAGLPVDEVALLAAARLGRRLEAAESADLAARTDGNPFYIGELARLVGRSGASQTAIGVPDTVRGVVAQRLAGLPAADVDALVVAAVAGRAFDLDLVGAVCGLGEDALDALLDRAVRAGVLREEPTDEGDARFVHALLQETLLDEAGPSRRRRLHRRVARALADQRRDPVGRRPRAELVAHHHLAAGGDADLRDAVELLLEAAGEATGRRSVLEVRELLAEAAAAAARLGSEPAAGDLAEVVRSRRAMFDLLVQGSSATSAEPADAGPTRASAGAQDVLVAALAQWGWQVSRGRIRAAAPVIADLARVAEERDDDVLRLAAVFWDGFGSLNEGRLADAAAAYGRVHRLLATVEVPPMITPHPSFACPLFRAIIALLRGEPQEAHRHWVGAAPRAREFAGPVLESYYGTLVVLWWTFAGDPERTAAAATEARDSIARTGVTGLENQVIMPAAWAHSHVDPVAGAAAARQAADRLDAEEPVLRPLFRALHADVLLRVGEAGDAVAAVDQGLAEAAETGATFWDAELLRLRARALRALGAPDDEVAAGVERARAIATEQGAHLLLERLARDHGPAAVGT